MSEENIVHRIRVDCEWCKPCEDCRNMELEAAAIIESLRAELAAAESECERLRTSEADLFDKCGELQKRIWAMLASDRPSGCYDDRTFSQLWDEHLKVNNLLVEAVAAWRSGAALILMDADGHHVPVARLTLTREWFEAAQRTMRG